MATDRALAGVRVLSMEQAAALPFCTRHLADMGAEVIRVESHKRGRGGALSEADLARNKQRLGLDLAAPGGPDVFRRLATHCDVVAHNFTPRVMRQFGIDYPSIRAVRPNVVYVSLTGFGTTGPWSERPLFGPGAEAVSGQNEMIGPADAWPGRPGTGVYADDICGLNAAFAILAALEHRDATGEGTHIDVSLYETSISHIGTAIAERAFGGGLPTRIGNHDANYMIQGTFPVAGHDRHVALSVRTEQVDALRAALGIDLVDEQTVRDALRRRDGGAVVEGLQAASIAAALVADSSDQAVDEHLWARGFFGLIGSGDEARPHAGPSFGGGQTVDMTPTKSLGADSEQVLREIAGFSTEDIAALLAEGVVGTPPPGAPQRNRPASDTALRIARGELSRVDAHHDAWRAFVR